MRDHFTIDARAILALGRESIKDHTTAILELVKNSYDAGAQVVVVEVFANKGKDSFIRVTDTGDGMDEKDIESKWLRIGYSEKRNSGLANGRRQIGEKGIGRLSADRLGGTLELRSQKRHKSQIGIKVCWDDFDRMGKDLSSIKILNLEFTQFEVPVPWVSDDPGETVEQPPPSIVASGVITGTQLHISNLRQRWTKQDIEDLHKELSMLICPFDNVKDFQIRLANDIDPKFDGVLVSPFFQSAEIECEFTYSAGDSVRVLTTVRDKAGKQQAPTKEVIKWEQFRHVLEDLDGPRKVKREKNNAGSQGPSFGTVKVVLNYYPRHSDTTRGTDLSLAQLRRFLDVHAGIKVYRDRVRVMPYGDLRKAEGGDWLGLGDRKTRNPAGAGRKDFRVAPNQIVGAVFLSKDGNPKLIDTSGREGLVHGDEFHELKSFLLGAIFCVEAAYHKYFLAKQKANDERIVNPRETVKDIGRQLKQLEDSIEEIAASFDTRSRAKYESIIQDIQSTTESLGDLRVSMDELASQATIYRGLASLGIALTTFSHETDSALEQFLSSLYVAQRILHKQPDQSKDALLEMEQSILAGEKISAWGNFALRRIKPDKRKRKKIDVTKLAKGMLDELNDAFQASGIDLRSNLQQVTGRFFPMDIESVILNLMTNAYFFAKAGRRKRQVRFDLRNAKSNGVPGVEIRVADSGSGVNTKIRDEIWNPLFSTKVDDRGRSVGSGLGLTIVSDVVSDLNGTKEVGEDNELLGARFSIWLPIS